MKYFYSLLLLLIPLFFRLILFILHDSGKRLVVELSEIVTQKPLNECKDIFYETPEGVKKGKVLEFALTPESSDLDLHAVLETYYYPALRIGGHMERHIFPKVKIISTITILVYYVVTALSFTYIIIHYSF